MSTPAAGDSTAGEAPRQIDWSRYASSPLVPLALVVLAIAIYAPSLGAWFDADDFWFLRASQTTPVGEYAAEAFDVRDTEPVPDFKFYRPLYVTSFRLQYELFGLDALGYHAVNVALHGMSTLLVWFIARRVARSAVAAAVAGLTFALHPAYAETVAWIARGNTGMVTFAYLLTFALFLRYADSGPRAAWWYAGSLTAFVIAVLYHPTATSLAAVLPAYVFLVAKRPATARSLEAWAPFVPFALVALAMMWVQSWARNHTGLADDFTFGTHQFTRYREYLGLALFPVVERNFQSGALRDVLDWFATLAMVGLSLFLLLRPRWPYAGLFTVWWLCVALAPSSTLATLPAISAQLYLPGAALAVFIVVAAVRAGELLAERARPYAGITVPVALVLALALIVPLTLRHEDRQNDLSEQNRRFLSALRAEIPSLEAGSRVYVVAPSMRRFVGESTFDALTELYYGEVDARLISEQEAAMREPRLSYRERIFRYQPK